MIVVEGPDGSGKTTLAGRLCEEYDLEYRRPPESLLSSTGGPSEGLVEWWRTELRRPNLERKLGVYDRCFWISEPIYSSLSLRAPLCPPDQLWRGIADLWAEDPLLIFCMTDETAMIENTYAGGKPRLASLEERETEKLRAINFLYWAFFGIWQQASMNVVHYDYARDHWQSYIGKAVEDHRKVRA
jgi:hypothetical protein